MTATYLHFLTATFLHFISGGDKEWWVIGDSSSGVAGGTANQVTLLLKSTGTPYGTSEYNSGGTNVYTGAELHQAMQGVFNGFSVKEQGLVVARTSIDVGDGAGSTTTLANQTVWPLSESEWTAIGNNTVRSFGGYWWLRSPIAGSHNTALAGEPSGDYILNFTVDDDLIAVRPAFILNLSSVIFTSDASGASAKFNATAGSGLQSVGAPSGTIKLTVNNGSVALATAAPSAVEGREVTVNISGATVGETLSAIVTDSGDTLKYYGKLKESISANDSATVEVPAATDFTAGSDKLKVLVEDINGDNLTDFASTPIEIAVAEQAAPTSLAGVAPTTATGSGKITGTTTAMEYSVDGTTWTACAAAETAVPANATYKVRLAGVVDGTTAKMASPETSVTVGAYVPTLVTGIAITGGSSITTKGGTLQLTADVTPASADNKAVTWSSSDANIATVDASAGLVTAKANGSVTITATAQDGSGVTGTASITITGQEDMLPTLVTGITVSGGNSISTKGGTLQLAADVTPANADNKAVTWSSGDTSIATVDTNGFVTAKANGSVTITATAQDGSGVIGMANITITGQENISPIAYMVTSGFPAFNGSGGRSATIDADNSKFVRLLQGGNVVPPANYMNTKGSTIITLNESYLKTFANGTYAFRAEFTDGYADLSLVVNVQSNETATPTPTAMTDATRGSVRTGDDTNLSIWIALVLIAGVSIFGMVMYRRKKARD